MKTTAYSLSYFLTQAIFAIATTIMITAVFANYGVFETAGSIIEFFVGVVIYGLTMILFSMSLSTFFSDSKLSSQIGSIILLMPMNFFLLLYNLNAPEPF